MAGLKTQRSPKAPKPIDPNKAVFQPPRLKPISSREYGKGGTPLSGAPDQGVKGAGIGYGGFNGAYHAGGPVSGDPDQDDDDEPKTTLREHFDKRARDNEEKYKDDKGYAPANPDADKDFVDEENTG